ncbi:MAG: hypothetical protein NTV28_05365 [Propionibacteriales bacterium]|nr:hypothetical protein [Propionibacteriales bacterium]
MRRLVFGLLSSCLVVAGLQAQARGEDTAPLDSEAKAFAEAAATGKNVEIVEDRTETETVWATPRGTFSTKISNAPVRVKGDDGWESINLDLIESDGVVRPRAAPGDVELSAGGRDPLLQVTVGDVTTSISWPGALPAPVLDGPAATYLDVIDDVDLRMTVTDGGVSQVLVVRTAAAAADPRLAQLKLATDVDNGRVEVAEGGGLSVLDDVGRTVGDAPAPIMWDSSGTVVGDGGQPVVDSSAEAVDRRTQGPVENDDVAPVELAVTGGDIVLEPHRDALTGADVQYPVYIDPKVGGRAFAWAMVFKQHPSSSFYKWTDDEGQGTGYQNYIGVSNKRLFFQYGISSLSGHQIRSATFKATMVWSPSCTTRPIKVYRSGGVSSDTTWNDQPSLGAFQDRKSYSAGHSGCNPGGRDVVWNIKNGMAAAAGDGRPSIGLALIAEDEADPLNWRRFKHNASITVEYNRRPSVPTSRTINGIACPTTGAVRLGRMTSYPVMRAKLADPDGNNVRPLWDWNAGSDITSAHSDITGSYVASGSTAAHSLSTLSRDENDTVKSGTWTFRVTAEDSGGLRSAASDECTFTIDSTLAAPPRVQGLPGVDDPSTSWEPGKSYQLTFAPGSTKDDVVGYRYSFSSDTPPTDPMLAASGSGKTHTLHVPARAVGLHKLRVWAYEASGNRSEVPFVHEFEVLDPERFVRSTYTFDDEDGSLAADSTGEFPLDIGDATRSTRSLYTDDDPDNRARDAMISLSESSQPPAMVGSFVDPRRSFDLALFVDPAKTATSSNQMTALSLGGENSPGLEIGAEVNGTGFDYVLRVWDIQTAAWVVARVPGDDGQPGTRPVVASYDVVTKKATLRVLGTNAATAVTPGTATLPESFVRQRLTVGASYDATRRWTGFLDQVVVARGPLTEDEISNFLKIWERTECVAVSGGC